MILQELCTYLEEVGLGIQGTDLFYGPMKEQYPDNVILVQENGGGMDEPDLGPAEGRAIRLESPEIAVICRGVKDDYDTPRAKAEAVRSAFVAICGTHIEGIDFLVAETRPVGYRGFDENFRNEFSVPARITKVPSND
jgi:hypothetical protein